MSSNITCREGYVDAGIGNVYYLTYSSPESTGTPIIMIHGGPGFTHHYLEPMFGLASERPVIFYDQLGCGKSDQPTDLSYCSVEYFVHELSTLIEHLGYEKVSLLGHSWGSTVASEYAMINNNVSHLILASPYMSSPLWNEDIVRYKKALPKNLRMAIERNDYNDKEFLEAHQLYYDRHVYGQARNDRSIQLATETASTEVYNTMWGTDEFSIIGKLQDYDCGDRIKAITAKTLFIAGENDTGSPRACREMSKHISGSIVHAVKGCAHFPHLELKVEYNSYIRDFLNDLTKALPAGILERLKRLLPGSQSEISL